MKFTTILLSIRHVVSHIFVVGHIFGGGGGKGTEQFWRAAA